MNKIIAIDFDGCLCENAYPTIGAAHDDVITRAKKEQFDGAKLVLWTCREGERLNEAVRWCANRGLYFDEVNNNTPEMTQLWGTDPRKVGASEYWDDKAVVMPRVYDTQVCTAVRRDPYGFVDILREAAEDNAGVHKLLLDEAACVVANLLEQLRWRDINIEKPNTNQSAIVYGANIHDKVDTDDYYDGEGFYGHIKIVRCGNRIVNIVDRIDGGERGDAGFGSTGRA